MTKCSERIYGFKLLWYQLQNMESHLHRLEKNGWKIVHISRSNIFEQSLSLLMAFKSGKWHNYEEGRRKHEKLRIELFELKEMYKEVKRVNSEVESVLKRIDCIHINYEKHLSDSSLWQRTGNEIFSYLGVPEMDVESRLKKTYSAHYSELIENYYELRCASLRNWDC